MPDPERWERDGVVFRLVDGATGTRDARRGRPARACTTCSRARSPTTSTPARRPSTSSCTGSARTPATAGTTGGWPSSSTATTPAAGRRPGRHGQRVRHRARRRPTSPTSACSSPPAAAAWPRACCARSSPTPPPAAATASASRSTPTRPPAPTGLYTSMGWDDEVRHRVLAPRPSPAASRAGHRPACQRDGHGCRLRAATRRRARWMPLGVSTPTNVAPCLTPTIACRRAASRPGPPRGWSRRRSRRRGRRW